MPPSGPAFSAVLLMPNAGHSRSSNKDHNTTEGALKTYPHCPASAHAGRFFTGPYRFSSGQSNIRPHTLRAREIPPTRAWEGTCRFTPIEVREVPEQWVIVSQLKRRRVGVGCMTSVNVGAHVQLSGGLAAPLPCSPPLPRQASSSIRLPSPTPLPQLKLELWSLSFSPP